ncbi:hypothetical protein [Salegentibacter chungangensis]|uniref:Adhesin domain-containing protein n=1 Tax=Salegentibacter chungangensis TaxID=1335724 RepID=A0ABW3NSZ8_9FLAO
MKTILYKLFFIALLAPGLSFCNNDFNGKHTKQKKISKEYTVAADATLKIDNSYGNIDISTWDQNKVSIEVTIKVNGNDEEKLKKRLDEINVSFNQTSSGVSAKTNFGKENKSWWDELFGGSNNVNMEVNYVVKAPESNNVDLRNDYGGIYIDKLSGNAKISCDYGKIDIGELLGGVNYLNFDYTKNSHIDYVKNAEINADYSEYVIEEAGNLIINADYTSSKVMKAENMKFGCDYGSINVEKVRNLEGNGDYLSTKIGRVFGSLDLKLDYGSASIEKIVESTKSVNIDTDYTGVKIGYDPEQAFSFDLTTSYGSIKGVDGFEIEKRHESGQKKSFSGYNKSKDNSSKIRINTSYGSISFNQK